MATETPEEKDEEDRFTAIVAKHLAGLADAIVRIEKLEREVLLLQHDGGSSASAIGNAVRQALDSIAPRLERIDSLVPLNESQVKLLEEARDERIRRSAEDALRKDLEMKARRERADADATARAKRSFWLKLAALAIGVLTPLTALLGTYLALKH